MPPTSIRQACCQIGWTRHVAKGSRWVGGGLVGKFCPEENSSCHYLKTSLYISSPREKCFSPQKATPSTISGYSLRVWVWPHLRSIIHLTHHVPCEIAKFPSASSHRRPTARHTTERKMQCNMRWHFHFLHKLRGLPLYKAYFMIWKRRILSEEKQ